MKSRHYLAGAFIAAAALLSGCDDDNSPAPVGPITNPTPPGGSTPPPASLSFSQFAASLIAMVMGNSCATATPTDINAATVSDDMMSVDANTITVNCT